MFLRLPASLLNLGHIMYSEKQHVRWRKIFCLQNRSSQKHQTSLESHGPEIHRTLYEGKETVREIRHLTLVHAMKAHVEEEI